MADEKDKNEDALFSDLPGELNADPFASNDSADPLAPSGADDVFGQSASGSASVRCPRSARLWLR